MTQIREEVYDLYRDTIPSKSNQLPFSQNVHLEGNEVHLSLRMIISTSLSSSNVNSYVGGDSNKSIIIITSKSLRYFYISVCIFYDSNSIWRWNIYITNVNFAWATESWKYFWSTKSEHQ